MWFRSIFIFFLTHLIFPGLAFSQAADSLGVPKKKKRVAGSLSYSGVPITQILTVYGQVNQARKTIPGYRVQIHYGNDRDKAREVKGQFLSLFVKHYAYESYTSPNFRIRAGDFRTRLEAFRFHRMIRSSFPSSYVVEEHVAYPQVQRLLDPPPSLIER